MNNSYSASKVNAPFLSFTREMSSRLFNMDKELEEKIHILFSSFSDQSHKRYTISLINPKREAHL